MSRCGARRRQVIAVVSVHVRGLGESPTPNHLATSPPLPSRLILYKPNETESDRSTAARTASFLRRLIALLLCSVDGFELLRFGCTGSGRRRRARHHGRGHRRAETAAGSPGGARRQVLAQVGRPSGEVRAALRRAADVLRRERQGERHRGGLAGRHRIPVRRR